MEGNVGNRRNDHHHESHHHHHENHHHHDRHQIPWNFIQEPSTGVHLPTFGQLSTSSSSSPPPPLSSFNNQNNHHHHFDAFLHSPAYLPVEAKASQPFLFPSTDFFDSDFPHPSPCVPSDSLTLKLGKRHYYENASSGAFGKLTPADEPHVSGFSLLKRGREFLSHFHLHHHYQHQSSLASSTPPSMLASGVSVLGTPVPRCQVEGCNVGLMGAKEYHRRHKVCEMHSKAPKVIVQGLEQRFCQQCSRFHVVSEFDDSKRSCRRRLAGHNERRRKNASDSTTRNSSHEGRGAGGRLPLAHNTSTSSSAGRALSLLSSDCSPTWSSPAAAAAPADDDLSSRSSAALRELIAENRAAAFAKQLPLPADGSVHPHDDYPSQALGHRHNHQPLFPFTHAAQGRHAPQSHPSGVFEPVPPTTAAAATTTTTLELMQATHAQPQHQIYQLMAPRSGRSGAGEDEDSIECEIWRSIQ
ncbi:unnamed protein product [Victoria cruziana]